MKNVRSGRCELFRKGILIMSWTEVDGKKVGHYTMYEKGKAVIRGNWSFLWNTGENRWIENYKNGLQLVIGVGDSNQVIYRGGFDNVESMRREGRGVEFDEKSGRMLRCGVWKNDELFQITQEFESEEMMIEYATEEGKENVSLLNRHPVYEGGYVFDEEKRVFLRNGYGCEIEGGVAVREEKWERGELKESTELFEGWYAKMDDYDFTKWNMSAEIHNRMDLENASKIIVELVIPSKCCNEEELSSLDVSDFKRMVRLEIGDYSFHNVEEVKLMGLKKLKRVVVGKGCFGEYSPGTVDDGKPNRRFYLKNCEELKEMKIGCESFSDYSVCEIENVPSLEVIEIGTMNEASANFYCASLELKNLPSLKSLLVGWNAFHDCPRVVLENLPQLASIQISDYCFTKTEQLDLIGLNALGRVVIGNGCFTEAAYDTIEDAKNPNRRFCLKSCGRLRVLKIGCYSFSDYSVCKIETIPSLEVIEMGELNEASYNFYHASLELKNLPKLKSLIFGTQSFVRCSRVVFENLTQLTSIRLGRNAFFFDWDDSKSGILIMKNLPKLAVLTTEGDKDDSSSFTNPSIIDIENLPQLTIVLLTNNAFQNKKKVTAKNAGALARYFKSGLPFFQNGDFIL